MRVIIAGGGTGGHLFPGLAIAEEFKNRADLAEVIFVGTGHGIEARVVPRQGQNLSLMSTVFRIGYLPIEVRVLPAVELPSEADLEALSQRDQVVVLSRYIFPATANLFRKFDIDLPPMTKATLAMSDFLVGNIWWIIIASIVPVVLAGRFITTEKGRFLVDRYVWSVTVIGGLLHKMSIEIFCRVFYALYSGAGENIDVIRMAAEASGNKYMEHQIKTIALPMMIQKGAGITEEFEATGVFTKTAIARFHSGAETGTVKNTAFQLAEYYEKETTYKMRNAIDFIQLALSMVIMVVLTMLTLVSSETATFHPNAMPGAS